MSRKIKTTQTSAQTGQVNPLEEQMFEDIRAGKKIGKDISLERALLIASGVDNECIISVYQARIDDVYTSLITDEFFELDPEKGIEEQALNLASTIYDYIANLRALGTIKGEYSFIKIIDMLVHNINPEPIDCFGMTLIYSVLAIRAGLDISVIEKTNHIHNRIKTKGLIYDIDHRLLEKIELQEKPEGREHDVYSLAPFTYIKRADREFCKGNYQEAIKLYTQAILIDPKLSERAHLNRACSKIDIAESEDDKTELYLSAEQDLLKAEQINPNSAEVLINLLYICAAFFRKEDAARYCHRVLDLDPSNEAALDFMKEHH